MSDYNRNYYREDSRVGERCTIDGKDAYLEFNADLKEFVLSQGKLESDYRLSTGNSHFQIFHSSAEEKKLELEFYVGGPSQEAVQTNISNLLQALRQCGISRGSDVFEYAAVLVDNEVEETEVEPYYLVTCELAAVRRKPLVTCRITGTSSVYNDGNTASGVRIEFKAPVTGSIRGITVFGVTISPAKNGATYVIDGINGKVTENGVNCFQLTDLIDFPKIKPGMNEIEMSVSMDASVSFFPVFA